MAKLLRFFELRQPQIIAGLLLLAFFAECLYVARGRPLDFNEVNVAFAAKRAWSATSPSLQDQGSERDESIFALSLAGALPALEEKFDIANAQGRIYAAPNRLAARLPFIFFGLWLGGALWWVSRRLYGNEGGYFALSLYCFSPVMVLSSAALRSDILVAWGVFGLVFTAIGVAHTLYAPARKWKARTLLLGAAIGLTAAASRPAAMVALLFALAFILYLAPGRRLLGATLLGISCLFGALVCWAFYGFRVNIFDRFPFALQGAADMVARYVAHPSTWIFAATFLLCVLVYLIWPRARYFGNTAPLLVGCALFLVIPGGSLQSVGNTLKFPTWAVPFACVFMGGIFADLLEGHFENGRYRKYVRRMELLLLVANAALCLLAIHQGQKPWLRF